MSRRQTPPDSSTHRGCGCREYDALSRRSFLGVSSSFLALAAGHAWLPRVVLADSHSSSRDVIVNIFLRGGMDSLSVFVPYSEPRYYAMRPNLAIPPPLGGAPGRAVDLDGQFGLAPALAPLLEAYQDGALLPVLATGSHDPTRSHFDAMRFMETGSGSAQPTVYTGWLGRHLQTTAPTQAAALVRGLAIGYAVPQSLVGGPATLPVPDPANYGLAEPDRQTDRDEDRLATLDRMYANAVDYLKLSAQNTLATIDLLETIDFAGYQPSGGADYGPSDLGMALESAAALIKADVGVEAISIDYSGWDTHEQQAPLSGQMAFVMAGLGEALAAFHKDLFVAGRTDVVVTAMSEFGRNAFENGSGGTDHGHAGAMLLLGGAIDGGRVLTEWPGLEPENLYDGQDLAVTIDYRDILTEIATKRLGNSDWRNIFPDPGYSPVERGVVT